MDRNIASENGIIRGEHGNIGFTPHLDALIPEIGSFLPGPAGKKRNLLSPGVDEAVRLTFKIGGKANRPFIQCAMID